MHARYRFTALSTLLILAFVQGPVSADEYLTGVHRNQSRPEVAEEMLARIVTVLVRRGESSFSELIFLLPCAR